MASLVLGKSKKKHQNFCTPSDRLAEYRSDETLLKDFA